VASVLDFVRDQLYPITAVVFATASFGLILRSRRRRPPDDVPLAGLRTAAIASVVSAALLAVGVLAIAWVLRGLLTWTYYYGDGPAPTPPQVDPTTQLLNALSLLAWFVSVPVVTFLVVLDLYAMRPPRPEGPSRVALPYGALGVLISALLFAVTLYIPVAVDDANATAAARDAARDARAASEELARYVEERSAGLSIEVTVVDVGFGAATQKGRIVEHVTLDIRLRSATAIALPTSEDGFGSNLLQLYPAYAPDAGYTPPMYLEWKDLPADITAGFDATFRLDVPVTGTFPADQTQPDPVTSGSWSAELMLHDRSPEPARTTSVGPVEPYYSTSTTFVISAP
jgi:hypothetical protein